MARVAALSQDLNELIFNATAIANIADNAADTPLTDLYVSLHTADPSAGNQQTNEISYTGYARVAVARDSAHWNVAADSVSPVNPIVFGQMTAGVGGVVTHFGIGSLISGAGRLLFVSPVTPVFSVVNGVAPRLETSPGAIKMGDWD